MYLYKYSPQINIYYPPSTLSSLVQFHHTTVSTVPAHYLANFARLTVPSRFYRSWSSEGGVLYCRFNERQTHRDRYNAGKRAITELLLIVEDDGDDVFIATNRRSCGAPAAVTYAEKSDVFLSARWSLEISTSSTCAYVRDELVCLSHVRVCVCVCAPPCMRAGTYAHIHTWNIRRTLSHNYSLPATTSSSVCLS